METLESYIYTYEEMANNAVQKYITNFNGQNKSQQEATQCQ